MFYQVNTVRARGQPIKLMLGRPLVAIPDINAHATAFQLYMAIASSFFGLK